MARALGLGPRGREFESRIPEIGVLLLMIILRFVAWDNDVLVWVLLSVSSSRYIPNIPEIEFKRLKLVIFILYIYDLCLKKHT